MLQIPGATSYMGSIGKDKFGEEMKKNAKQAGVNVSTWFVQFVYLQLLSSSLIIINIHITLISANQVEIHLVMFSFLVIV